LLFCRTNNPLSPPLRSPQQRPQGHSAKSKFLAANYKDGEVDGLWLIWHENGQKRSEQNYKNGKWDGLLTTWHKNGQKLREANYKDGNIVEGSDKYWNSKGEPVDSEEEAKAE